MRKRRTSDKQQNPITAADAAAIGAGHDHVAVAAAVITQLQDASI